MNRLLLISALTSILLTGCGGGGGDNNADDGTQLSDHFKVTNEKVLAAHQISVTRQGGAWSNDGSPVEYRSHNHNRRFAVDPDQAVYIPIQFNDVQHAEEAADLIEDHLGYKIFDRESLAGIPHEEVELGIVFMADTAVGMSGQPDAGACGNVSTSVGGTYHEAGWYGTSAPGVIDSRIYVNIGNGLNVDYGCKVDVKLVFHELLHALGLINHNESFNDSMYKKHFVNKQILTVLHNVIKMPIMTYVGNDSEELSRGHISYEFPFGYDSGDESDTLSHLRCRSEESARSFSAKVTGAVPNCDEMEETPDDTGSGANGGDNGTGSDNGVGGDNGTGGDSGTTGGDNGTGSDNGTGGDNSTGSDGEDSSPPTPTPTDIDIDDTGSDDSGSDNSTGSDGEDSSPPTPTPTDIDTDDTGSDDSGDDGSSPEPPPPATIDL